MMECISGKWYKVVDSRCCTGCAFEVNRDQEGACDNCAAHEREDGRDVKFVPAGIDHFILTINGMPYQATGFEFNRPTPKVYCDKRTNRFKEDLEQYFHGVDDIFKIVVSTDRHAVRHIDFKIVITYRDGKVITLQDKSFMDWSSIEDLLSFLR